MDATTGAVVAVTTGIVVAAGAAAVAVVKSFLDELDTVDSPQDLRGPASR